jgi:hypothetical protein
MKNKILSILIIILFIGQHSLASGYEVAKKNDSDKGYIFYTIKKNDKEIANFCLINPEKGFYFFSVESDSTFFKKSKKDFFLFAAEKKFGEPVCAIMADFSTKITITKKTWSFGYFFNSLGILVFSPPYLKKAEILNPSQTSKRFFIEIKKNEKNYYGLLVTDSLLEVKEARELIRNVKGLEGFEGNPTPILDFPIKLLSFDGKYTRTIYESHKRHKNYTCMFLTGKIKTVPK